MSPPPIFSLTAFFSGTRRATASLVDSIAGITQPNLRLGVTGLSRAGKTVFITALVHALVSRGRLPVFTAGAERRIRRVYLEPQPDDLLPRFSYEDHLVALTGADRHWPQSTRQISELRLVIEYQSATRWFGSANSTLTIDIVDYPGEWLLDLSLLGKSYEDWARETLEYAGNGPRAGLSTEFLACMKQVDPRDAASEPRVIQLAESFTAYLRACREQNLSLSCLLPGRFLMPGELEGSPVLTFAPVRLDPENQIEAGSLAAMMERRFEAYKTHVVKPFFREHFARLDRQIVLIDVLSALSSGPESVRELEETLAGVLKAFNVGQNTLLSSLFSPRIEKVLFAATKADHLHHSSHDQLEAILRMLVAHAAVRAEASGAAIDVVALASVRATREVNAFHEGEKVPCIAGVPLEGERLDMEIFDGHAEAAVFPGYLPSNPADAFNGGAPQFKSLRFRPPTAERGPDGKLNMLPSIRLDRVIEFLIGDKLR